MTKQNQTLHILSYHSIQYPHYSHLGKRRKSSSSKKKKQRYNRLFVISNKIFSLYNFHFIWFNELFFWLTKFIQISLFLSLFDSTNEKVWWPFVWIESDRFGPIDWSVYSFWMLLISNSFKLFFFTTNFQLPTFTLLNH